VSPFPVFPVTRRGAYYLKTPIFNSLVLDMRHCDIKEKIPELLPGGVDWDQIVRFGDLTKLRVDGGGRFHHANYESGLLLYAIVRRFKPRRILEIGTGRGFGAVCMAQALCDEGIDGCIITVDTIPHDQKQTWPIDDGAGPKVEQLSVQEVWQRYFGPELRDKVEFRHGFSTEAMAQLEDEGWQPDFVYIDGDHTFASAKHDFFCSLLLARRPFRLLLDDYTPHSNHFGVRRVVDRYVNPFFAAEAIYNDGRWFGEGRENEPIGAQDYAQVLVDSEKMTKPFEKVFPPARVHRIVQHQRRFGWLGAKWESFLAGLRRRSA